MYIDERHFVKTAIQNMGVLERAWTDIDTSLASARVDQTNASLDKIKSTAASVQARGVYRAAVMCENVLARLNADNMTKMTSSLVELNRLVHSYADGLFEIDPEFAEVINQPEEIAEELPKTDVNLADAHASAVKTLSPLIQRVKDDKLRSALTSLMQPVTMNSSRRSDRKTMSLDALIQPISNLVLSEARHCGKVVTVSYAADFADLSFEIAETVQDILEAACLKIVAKGIPKASETLPGTTPQISLTGQSRGGNILFSVSWMGEGIDTPDNPTAGFQSQMQRLEQRGGSYSFNNLALSDNLKSRHTLYITMPLSHPSSLNTGSSRSYTKLEMGIGHHG